jgi:hypothetical protein
LRDTTASILNIAARPAQHQGSLTEQMIELQHLARHFGLYDADDWIIMNFFTKLTSDQKKDL